MTEQHRERRQSHSHVGQNDFQSQQTRPKREEDGERYISFPTFFQINARPWRRQPDILPRDEEVWRSTDLCTLPAPCQAPFQTTAWPLGPRGLSIWTLSTTRLSALLGHPKARSASTSPPQLMCKRVMFSATFCRDPASFELSLGSLRNAVMAERSRSRRGAAESKPSLRSGLSCFEAISPEACEQNPHMF